MRSLAPLTLSLITSALLAGCAASPSNDVTSTLREKQRTYCSETSPATRAVALALIRSRVPGYPTSGLCTDAQQALAEEISRQLADLPPGAAIDIEQAMEDQRRFEEMNDASGDTQASQD